MLQSLHACRVLKAFSFLPFSLRGKVLKQKQEAKQWGAPRPRKKEAVEKQIDLFAAEKAECMCGFCAACEREFAWYLAAVKAAIAERGESK